MMPALSLSRMTRKYHYSNVGPERPGKGEVTTLGTLPSHPCQPSPAHHDSMTPVKVSREPGMCPGKGHALGISSPILPSSKALLASSFTAHHHIVLVGVGSRNCCTCMGTAAGEVRSDSLPKWQYASCTIQKTHSDSQSSGKPKLPFILTVPHVEAVHMTSTALQQRKSVTSLYLFTLLSPELPH